MEITYKIIGTDGLQYGPIALEQLKLWVGEGRISRETKVLRSDTNSWLPAAQYAELGLVQPLAGTFPPTLATLDDPVLEKRIKSGADWFFWIAGLSLVNSAIALSGNGMAFALGLGITQVIDTMAAGVGPGGVMVAAILDLLVAGVFILFGVFSRRHQTWSFVAGMILYALDALIFLMSSSWLSLGFHGFALFCIFAGWRANTQLKGLEKGLLARPL